MLGIRLPIEIEQRLEALAKATGRTKTFYAREAILRHLDDLEDLYLAEQRMTAFRAGEDEAVSGEEFWHGVADFPPGGSVLCGDEIIMPGRHNQQ